MTYELIDRESANTFADYDDEPQALAAWQALYARHAARARTLVLVAFDDDGMAVRSWTADEAGLTDEPV